MSIPKTFHAFWGGPELPDELAGYLAKWRELHPEWKFNLWTPENIPELRNQDLYDHPEVYSPKSNPWQYRSNLVRYELLHDVGGVYIDCDLEPLRPMDELVECGAFIAKEDRNYVNNAFMGSVPGSEWLVDILGGLRRRIIRKRDKRSNRQTGAHYLTEVLKRHPEVEVLPSELVYPFHWSELHNRDRVPVAGAYTRHMWWNKTTEAASG